jgi:GxxExxY protein
MLIELDELGLICKAQHQITVFYNDENVGEYFADILVENKVIIELKAVEGISERHEAQLINYLRATEMEVGLLLNFGKKPEYKRKVFSNHQK